MPSSRKASHRHTHSTALTPAAGGTASPARTRTASTRCALSGGASYVGVITLAIDVTNVAQGIFRVDEVIPVESGELTLLYPKWLPGYHSPAGPINKVAGLSISAVGSPLAWHRDKYDAYAFRVVIPDGVTQIHVRFQYLSARHRGEGRIEMTPCMLCLAWNNVSIYPAGYATSEIMFVPSIALPAGWQLGTALELATRSRNIYFFGPTTYDRLVDSPVFAGRYFRRIDLDPLAKTSVYMNVIADAPRCLAITSGQVRKYRNLIQQAYALFRFHHYAHYDFLVSLSNQLSGKGVEHSQSSENSVRTDYFLELGSNAAYRDLLAHEFVHSWNGKFRRPSDLWAPTFNRRLGNSLLWMYEGLTQYWGYVLTARAGLWTPREFRRGLARVAAVYDRERPGFQWRNIQDTTNDPVISCAASDPYPTWQLTNAYYSGGLLVWLAVDAKLRSLTSGRKSLDSFAHAFFGVANGMVRVMTYTFGDVVQALGLVAKYDWTGFLRSRVDANAPPMDGIEASGWRLVYADHRSRREGDVGKSRPWEFMFSIGLAVSEVGRILDILWDGPAFSAGVSSGATLVAVNGDAFTFDVLEDSIRSGKDSLAAIELLVKHQNRYRNVSIDYHGGLKYPQLVRVDGTRDELSEIIKAR